MRVLILFLFIVGCAADDPLSRGEFVPGGGNNKSTGDDFDLPSRVDFDEVILPLLDRDCAMCHSNKTPSYDAAMALVEVGVPTRSVLYKMATGDGHMKVWAPDRPEAQALAKWIRLEDLD